jgi:hypothetical protein
LKGTDQARNASLAALVLRLLCNAGHALVGDRMEDAQVIEHHKL